MGNEAIRVKHTQAGGNDRVEIYAAGGELPFMHAEWPMEGDAQSSAVAALYAGIDKAYELIDSEILADARIKIISTTPGAVERIIAEGDAE